MTAEAVSTVRINPTPFLRDRGIQINNKIVYLLLLIFVLGGFWLRAVDLSNESLGEDEWKKLQTVEDYRANGLTGANGEHPLLLKGILTISVSLSERWNNSVALNNPKLHIPVETALRLPVTIFGALSAILIFLIAAELFGVDVGLIAAALWTFDPAAIGFARIAKEDVILTFFFMLANVLFLRGQRDAENSEKNWIKWIWLTAIAYGAMMATKYMPHFLAISAAYYFTFQAIPSTKWRIGPKRWFLFLVIVSISFLFFNPTILLPDTWRAIISFVSENRVGYKVESSYEYMDVIYRNKMTLWLNGVPWHFYYVFMLVKLPLITIAAFLIGLVQIFRKRLGDGRWFVFWWCFFWFMPFSILGGKFLRYFSFASPVVMIVAGVGVIWLTRKIAELAWRGRSDTTAAIAVFAVALIVCIAAPLVESIRSAPHYRLYTNVLGGGQKNAGAYFPHDEFFDSRLSEAMKFVSENTALGTRVFSETPKLTEFHARRYGREDLICLWLSDPTELEKMQPGDIVIDARGRRYLSNDQMLKKLENAADPAAIITLGDIPAVDVYKIDASWLTVFRN